MNNLFESISEEMFKEKVVIRFDNINEGFNRFTNFMLESKCEENCEAELIEFLKKALKLNGDDNSYVDFYFSRLDVNSKQKLFDLLDAEDKKILERYDREVKEEKIYFRLNDEILPFLARLCTREILFCTFYYTKFPCTIWGNYNMKFPIFFDSEEIVESYNFGGRFSIYS